jgi:hypothetical protein
MHVQIEHMTAARRAEEEARTQREKDEKERRSRTRWEQPEAVAEPSLDDAADLVAVRTELICLNYDPYFTETSIRNCCNCNGCIEYDGGN